MNPRIYFNEVNERQGVFHRREFLLGGVTGLGFAALTGRLAFLQLIESDKFKTLSLDNEFQSRLQPAPRGLILDRDGVILASNRPDFRLYVSRDEGTDVESLLDRLQKLVPLDDAHRARLIEDLKDAPRRAPVTVMEDLTWEEFCRINVRSPELPGVTADMGDIRVYPYSAAFAHVIGYVAKVSAKDITKTGPNSDPILLNPGFRIGKAGLEKTFDLDMRGKPGVKKVEVDVKGRVVREDPGGDVPATPGETLKLTLDLDIQNRALEVFGAESGAAVMMDCRTGNVLCMFSAPSFDANSFVKGITGPEYRALADYERKPLLNKAIDATYPPGSTFKTMVALAALQQGIPASTVHVCNKTWFWGGRVWHCDKAHGALDMKGAIAQSCDIYFYQLALQIGGPDPIAAVATRFGLGKTFDIGIPNQRPGVIPTRAYKR
ncbi:MAG: penicillin-binding transpeptidase domain-containing protein, partial [Caulobacteraceae bacterium]